MIANGYNLTLASLGLVEPEKTDHAEPEEILASIAEKERKILDIIEEMQELVTTEGGNGH
jgi:type I restriction enzyme M protein